MNRLTVITISLALLAGCERVQVRVNPDVVRPASVTGVRYQLGPSGLGNLIDAAQTDGFRIVGEPRFGTIADATIGPIDQAVAIESQDVNPMDGAATLSMRLPAPNILVPVRLTNDLGIFICRFSVRTGQVDVLTTVTLPPDATQFVSIAEPIISGANFEVQLLGDCPFDSYGIDRAALEDALIAYTSEAVAASAVTSSEISPIETLGITTGETTVEPISSFSNRTGRIDILQREGTLSLDTTGLQFSLLTDISSERAGCVPPDAPPTILPSEANSVSLQAIEERSADAVIVMSHMYISQLAHAATLSGLSCRGRERFDDSTFRIETVNALLSEVSLDQIPVGTWVYPEILPGAIPEISFSENDDTVEVTWKRLTLSLYGEVHGTEVRLIRVDAPVSVRLKPRVPSIGGVSLEVDTIVVGDTSFDSEWVSDLDPTVLNDWARRLFLIQFEDETAFGLPISLAAEFRVTDVDVRNEDVVMFLNFTL